MSDPIPQIKRDYPWHPHAPDPFEAREIEADIQRECERVEHGIDPRVPFNPPLYRGGRQHLYPKPNPTTADTDKPRPRRQPGNAPRKATPRKKQATTEAQAPSKPEQQNLF